MRFFYDFGTPAALAWLMGCAVVFFGFAALLVLRSVQRTRAVHRFGDADLVHGLQTYDAAVRRTIKGAVVVTAMACVFGALARPQFGRGTRLIPATNLDVVLVLDYSKSMYARDVVPSRIVRAKAEVARLIQQLPGARFAAVAFAGEPLSFPLTSDGAAIAQFFRQLDPTDMPVGGTATARALARARDLLHHDPRSKDHVKIIVLVTDGEDLEGNPVLVAKECAADGIRVDVVQIGGRAPEPIPDMGPDGKMNGFRKEPDGKIMTTSLSAEGEAQLAQIAETTGGVIVRSEHGETGIDAVARGLTRMMREELSERVETVYAEEYAWPLGIGLVLLVFEALFAEAPRRRRKRKKASAAEGPATTGRREAVGRAASVAASLLTLAASVAACGWDPRRPFERNAPLVSEALRELGDGGDAGRAVDALTEYLSTGPCTEGNIGTPDRLRERPDGTFDLGLALFRVGELFGRRFGEEEPPGGGGEEGDSEWKARRHGAVECAQRVVTVVAADTKQSIELRSQAHYLRGNLHFLDSAYGDAVAAYDEALTLWPGMGDAGVGIGADAAWNRAVALRRKQEEEDRKKDAGPPDDKHSPDGGQSSQDGGTPSPDGGDPKPPEDGGSPQSSPDDGKPDGQAPPPEPPEGGTPPPEDEDAGGPPPPSSASQDERILDQLERAPLVQQEAAKREAAKRRVRGMVDK